MLSAERREPISMTADARKKVLDREGRIVYSYGKKIYGCYEWLWPSLPFGDNKDTAELTVGEGRATRRCSEVERIVLAVLSIFLCEEAEAA